jgi:hypothetical protein
MRLNSEEKARDKPRQPQTDRNSLTLAADKFNGLNTFGVSRRHTATWWCRVSNSSSTPRRADNANRIAVTVATT